MADIFAVVADATRRDLLRILLSRGASDGGSTGELSVSELVAELGLSQPTVSKHLRVLRDAGLVSVREKGQHRFYRLQAAPLLVVEEWLLPFAGPAQQVTWSAEALPSDAEPTSIAGTSPEAEVRVGAAGTALATSVGRLAADIHSRVGRNPRDRADTPR